MRHSLAQTVFKSRASLSHAVLTPNFVFKKGALRPLLPLLLHSNSITTGCAYSPQRTAAMSPTAKQVCQFGSQCYRKNPQHFLEFSHSNDLVDADDDTEDDIAPQFGGVSPSNFLKDGVSVDAHGQTLSRNGSAYVCSCAGWKLNGNPENARTCRHLRLYLGELYENARVKTNAPAARVLPASFKSAAPPSATQASPATTKRKAVPELPDNEPLNSDNDIDESTMSQPLDVTNIKGIQPKKLFADGEAIEEFGYKQKRTHDHYYCTCPAWRMNGKPVDARTCKHLKAILGEEYEAARLKWKNPHGEVPKSAATKTNRAKKAASSASDDDDADDAATKFSAKKRAKREETKAKQPALLLADKWDEAKTDPTGWWVSEKLDGVRALWDHERGEFVSRLGNVFTAPDWFKDTMPEKESLDGELFVGRGKFSETVSVVKTINSPHWKKITYQVFDSPTMSKLPFEDRIARLKALYPPDQTPTVHIVAQENCKDKAHVLQLLREVEAKGGEGLMLRQPRSLYVGKRSATLLKVKSFYDAEAVVIGYEAGKGKNNGVVGSLKCRMACGKEFKVGTGLSDAERSKPPKVGVIVTYRFQELTLDGVPRFPSFVGERLDADKPKDAVVRVVNTKD